MSDEYFIKVAAYYFILGFFTAFITFAIAVGIYNSFNHV